MHPQKADAFGGAFFVSFFYQIIYNPNICPSDYCMIKRKIIEGSGFMDKEILMKDSLSDLEIILNIDTRQGDI